MFSFFIMIIYLWFVWRRTFITKQESTKENLLFIREVAEEGLFAFFLGEILKVYTIISRIMQNMKTFVGCLSAFIIVLLCIECVHSTPLDDYVYANDTHFGWTVIRTYQQPDYNLYILNFTSQKWFDGMLSFSSSNE